MAGPRSDPGAFLFGGTVRTISYRWPTNAPRGDRSVHCDYCSVRWRRSQCVRDRAGRLACPDDRAGRDEVTLSEMNAASAGERRRSETREEGGFYPAAVTYTGNDDPTFLTQRTTRDEI